LSILIGADASGRVKFCLRRLAPPAAGTAQAGAAATLTAVSPLKQVDAGGLAVLDIHIV